MSLLGNGPRRPSETGACDDWEVREQLIRIEERERIARDLHDVVGQALLGVGMHLDRVTRDVPNPARQRQLQRAVRDVEQISRDLREYIFQLRPCVAGPRTLADAMVRVAHDVETQTGASVRVALDQQLATRLHTHATELVKIAREALSNAIRHGKARRCTVVLMLVDDTAVLYIRDDGHGFEPTTATSGHGLDNMRERAARMGGCLGISTRRGGPTTVSVALPLRASAERSHLS